MQNTLRAVSSVGRVRRDGFTLESMIAVYVLQNKKGKLYIGQTDNIARRLEEHNQTGTGWTASHRPWKLVLKEEYRTRSQAMHRERYLKTGAGREWLLKHIIMRG